MIGGKASGKNLIVLHMYIHAFNKIINKLIKITV